MDQVNQLKQMRDEALTRLQYNPDYKLLVSLDRLIREMEQLISGTSKAASNSTMQSIPATSVTSSADAKQSTSSSKTTSRDSEIDKAFDKIASDLKDEIEGAAGGDVNADIKNAMAEASQ